MQHRHTVAKTRRYTLSALLHVARPVRHYPTLEKKTCGKRQIAVFYLGRLHFGRIFIRPSFLDVFLFGCLFLDVFIFGRPFWTPVLFDVFCRGQL